MIKGCVFVHAHTSIILTGNNFCKQPMNSDIADKPTILLIEKDPGQRTQLTEWLVKYGYQVLQAENGRQGIQQWKRAPSLRLIVADLHLMLHNGIDVMNYVRDNEQRYTYIIVLITLEDRTSVPLALDSGADEYLLRPVLEEELSLKLRNGERFLKLQSQDDLVFGLSEFAARRSGETGDHLKRIQKYCTIVSEGIQKYEPQLELSNQMIEDIVSVSPLHDIGKVGISDDILNKPGPLDKAEFELIKEHTTIGAALLQEIYKKSNSAYIRLAHEITRNHHERWNGSGYPDKLAGDNIPLAARIFAIADVYDALTSERCYKKVLSHKQAREIILTGSGIHFDPRLVACFLRIESLMAKELYELTHSI